MLFKAACTPLLMVAKRTFQLRTACFVSPVAPQNRLLCTKHLPPLVSAAEQDGENARGEVVRVPSCLTPPPSTHAECCCTLQPRIYLASAQSSSVSKQLPQLVYGGSWFSLPVHGYGQSTQSAEGTRSARPVMCRCCCCGPRAVLCK